MEKGKRREIKDICDNYRQLHAYNLFRLKRIEWFVCVCLLGCSSFCYWVFFIVFCFLQFSSFFLLSFLHTFSHSVILIHFFIYSGIIQSFWTISSSINHWVLFSNRRRNVCYFNLASVFPCCFGLFTPLSYQYVNFKKTNFAWKRHASVTLMQFL